MTSEFKTRAQRAGNLAEDFCEEHFGVVEGDTYEVKASSRRNRRLILRTAQLIQSGPKYYVIVCYARKQKKITRGPRKGRWIAAEKIEDAFKRRLEVHIVKGFDLLRILTSEKIPLQKTKVQNDLAWAFYWALPLKHINGQVLYEDDKVTVHGNPLDPPPFLNDNIQF